MSTILDMHFPSDGGTFALDFPLFTPRVGDSQGPTESFSVAYMYCVLAKESGP